MSEKSVDVLGLEKVELITGELAAEGGANIPFEV